MQQKIYQWSARDPQGNTTKGLTAAYDKQSVLLQLLTHDYTHLRCQRLWLTPFSKKRIKAIEITQLLHSLSQTLQAGIALTQSLATIHDGLSKPLLRDFIQQITHQIENGQSLHQSLEQYPQYFSHTETELIHLAETSGHLDQILTQIATQRFAITTLKTKVRKALTYPTLVLIVGMVITVVMLMTVVPKFAALYQNFNAALPAITQCIIDLAHGLKAHASSLVTIIIISALGIRISYRHSHQFKCYCDQWILTLPIIGKLLHQSQMTLFSQTLAMLLTAGIPLLNALQSLQQLILTAPYQQAMTTTIEQVASGQSLHQSLAKSAFFPRPFIQIIALGEQTGRIDHLLQTYATQSAQQVSQTVAQIQTLLEPLLMVLIGTIVAVLVMALYLPIFEMGNVI